MAPKKATKQTRVQAKASQSNKVLTGPKGSKPQATTNTQLVRQGDKTTTTGPKRGGVMSKTSRPSKPVGTKGINSKNPLMSAKGKPVPMDSKNWPKGTERWAESTSKAGKQGKPVGGTTPRALPPAGGTSGRVAATSSRRSAAEAKLQRAAQGTRSNVMRSRGPAAAPAKAPQAPKPSMRSRVGGAVRGAADRAGAQSSAVRSATRAAQNAPQAIRRAAAGAANRAGAQAGPSGRNLMRTISKGVSGGMTARAMLSGIGKGSIPAMVAKEALTARNTADGTLSAAIARGDYRPSRFTNARAAAFKKAAAIKGSPVVGAGKAKAAGSSSKAKASSSGGSKMSTAQSFDSSFAAARKAGKSVFTWRGKKYTTKLRGE